MTSVFSAVAELWDEVDAKIIGDSRPASIARTLWEIIDHPEASVSEQDVARIMLHQYMASNPDLIRI